MIAHRPGKTSGGTEAASEKRKSISNRDCDNNKKPKNKKPKRKAMALSDSSEPEMHRRLGNPGRERYVRRQQCQAGLCLRGRAVMSGSTLHFAGPFRGY